MATNNSGLNSVSIKHGLQTARTKDCRLGIKYGLSIKHGPGIKRGLRTGYKGIRNSWWMFSESRA